MKKTTNHYVKTISLLTVLIAVVFISFRPVLHCDFVNWDDDDYVLTNPLVKSLSFENIKQIFSTSVQKIYSPLVILSFVVEHHFFGFNPFFYHLDNLLLHCAIVALVFYFCLLLGFETIPAAFAALLFGLHPMHVESVAWVTERKDVLFVFFYMSALNCYLQYLNHKKWYFYSFAILCGLLSMLSKPMAVSLPFIFYLCDWFKRRPFDLRTITEKTVLFLYIIPIGFITYCAHHYQYKIILSDEILKTIWIFIFYLQKFLWPVSLGMFYNLPATTEILNFSHLFSVIALMLWILGLIILRKYRIFIFANVFYLLTICPGLRRVVEHSPGGPPFYAVDDRFMYLPSLGFCILFGFVLSQLIAYFKKQGFFKNISIILMTTTLFGFLSLATFFQCMKWKNSFVLWSSVIQQNPQAAIAYNNRGVIQKNILLALADYNKCIKLDPYFAEAYFNRAGIYSKIGNIDEAIGDYNKCLEFNPADTQSLHRRSELLNYLKSSRPK